MIRLAFFIHFNRTWLGGINVILNLINTIYQNRKNKTLSKIQIIIITNSRHKLKKYSINKKIEVIEDNNFFNKNIFLRIIDKISLVFFNKTIFFEKLLLKYRIDFTSHSNLVSGNNSRSKSIVWIPDFQYLHFPELFTFKNRLLKSLNLKIYAKHAYKILLSSFDAKKDLKKVCNIPDNKIVVNRFSFEVPSKKKLRGFLYLKKKYKLPKKFFYLPNQYWVHKNHKIVIETLKKIKDRNKNIFICSTGSKYDHRNPYLFENLMKTIRENKLVNNYKYFGVVPYLDVMSLMYHSLAVINPSYFEGWSSTVEQANSYGKIIILSNIKVHLEQNPSKGFFFNPNDSNSLAKIFLNVYRGKKIKKNKMILGRSQKKLKEKIKEYSDNYCNILNL